MQLSHDPARTHASFDDPNLVSRAGLVPVMALAQRCGLADLASEQLSVGGSCGVNAHLKVGCLVAGMAAGADSIDDMDILRHGATTELFGGIRAPRPRWGRSCARSPGATSGSSMRWPASSWPPWPLRRRCCPAATCWHSSTWTRRKTGLWARQARCRVRAREIQGKSLLIRGLNALAAVISTPLAAPVIAAARLRGGTANSARGAASLAAGAITTARQAGCTGLLIFRIDSAYYSAKVLHAIRRGGAHFSVTVPVTRKIRAAIASISEDAWTPVTYPRAIWDEDQQRLISDAEVAEVPYTAFASKKGKAITARLIVRRVRDLNPRAAQGQDELFTAWRHHAVFTDSPFMMIQAEAQHRDYLLTELRAEFPQFTGQDAGPVVTVRAHAGTGGFSV